MKSQAEQIVDELQRTANKKEFAMREQMRLLKSFIGSRADDEQRDEARKDLDVLRERLKAHCAQKGKK